MAAMSAVLFYLRFAWWIKMPPIFACWPQVSGSLADEDIIAKLLVESDPHKSLRFSIQKQKTPMLNTNLLISISNLLN
ncbi:PTS system transporter subunit IIA [Klebsiella pneumoniae]|uniref:PTS system transporter subunit IIA n=1 Tax=Klebsiella pneumoniae TaxID=573 RepID=A0A2X3EY00_KLEPN|nr:PTS system transporter subunit IIA [Klebsiella pneumoniae]